MRDGKPGYQQQSQAFEGGAATQKRKIAVAQPRALVAPAALRSSIDQDLSKLEGRTSRTKAQLNQREPDRDCLEVAAATAVVACVEHGNP